MLEIERRHVMLCMLDAVTKLTVLPNAWNRKTTCYVMYASTVLCGHFCKIFAMKKVVKYEHNKTKSKSIL